MKMINSSNPTGHSHPPSNEPLEKLLLNMPRKQVTNPLLEDRFSQVPSDVFRLIFERVCPEDQFALSKTCKRFHSFEWLQEEWRSRSIQAFEKLAVPFSKDVFVFGINKFGIPWNKIANCLSRPYGSHSSYRLYCADKANEYDEEEEEDLCVRVDYVGEKKSSLAVCLIIGDIKQTRKLKTISDRCFGDSYDDSKFLLMFEDYVCFKRHSFEFKEGVSYYGKMIKRTFLPPPSKDKRENQYQKLRLWYRYEGTASFPDGFSIFGMWKTVNNSLEYFHPREELIHPLHQQFLDQKRCTKFNHLYAPQIIYNGEFCQYCTRNCQRIQDTDANKWEFMQKCQCECKDKRKKRKLN